MLNLLLALTLRTQSVNAGRWQNFCERWIVAEDPTQYGAHSVDQLVSVYWLFRNQEYYSRTLIREMQRRLGETLSNEERELLNKTLANEGNEL